MIGTEPFLFIDWLTMLLFVFHAAYIPAVGI